MELKISEILSVAGTPGLFKYVAQANGGVIVESLDATPKRSRISGAAKVSALGDIAIFTTSGELSLGEVFDKAYAALGGKEAAVTSKSTPAELDAFMTSVLSDYDKDRVHNSDIKKFAQWYNILVRVGMTKFAETEESAEGSEAAKAVKKSATAAVKKPAATAAQRGGGAASSKSKAATGKSTTARKAQ